MVNEETTAGTCGCFVTIVVLLVLLVIECTKG